MVLAKQGSRSQAIAARRLFLDLWHDEIEGVRLKSGDESAARRKVAVYGDFKGNLDVFSVLEVERDFGRFRSWRPLEDFKQNRGGVLRGRARAGWRSLARGRMRFWRVTKVGRFGATAVPVFAKPRHGNAWGKTSYDTARLALRVPRPRHGYAWALQISGTLQRRSSRYEGGPGRREAVAWSLGMPVRCTRGAYAAPLAFFRSSIRAIAACFASHQPSEFCSSAGLLYLT